MAELIIQGGDKLEGSIEVRGCKNSAAPLLAATLLTSEPCVLKNVPRITDILAMIEIMESLGARITWTGPHELTVEAGNLSMAGFDTSKMGRMRVSILFLAPLLHRFSKVEIPEPGGCILGKRPIDTHLGVFSRFGVTVNRMQNVYQFERSRLKGAVLILPEISVTATENALMAAVVAEGTTILKLAAVEPHVINLVESLNRMGAHIELMESHTFRIEGVSSLHGATMEVIPDWIEVGTFAVLAAATRSELTIGPIIPEHLDRILLQLSIAGVPWDIEGDRLKIKKVSQLKAFKLQALPYPGFPTDLQAPFGVLATQAAGTSLIHDPLYEGRMGYVNELMKMGADAIIADPHRVIITGPTPLYGGSIKGLDLRAGATLVIAGLLAQGETRIAEAEQIDRGYEDLDGRLRALGARIERI